MIKHVLQKFLKEFLKKYLNDCVIIIKDFANN